MKKISPILIAVHSLLNSDGTSVYGTGSALPKLFHRFRLPWVRIQIPIYGGAPIRVEKELGGKPTSKSLTAKSWHELITVLAYTRSFESISIYIGIDPLNALFGILAKRVYKNINHVVYYTADYAHMRFENKLANHMYHAIDRFVLHHADQDWNDISFQNLIRVHLCSSVVNLHWLSRDNVRRSIFVRDPRQDGQRHQSAGEHRD